MGRYNPFTESEYDIIYSMKFLAKQPSDHVASVLGRNAETINRVSQYIEAAIKCNFDECKRLINTRKVNVNIEQWAVSRLGISFPKETPPEPEGDCKAQNGDDMTGKYLMKIVTEQAAQTQLFRELFNSIKSLSPALLADMQALRTSHTRMKESVDKMCAAVVALNGCIQDTSKEACSDLKDNVNANADMLHRKLDEIKINTRKKGL